MSFFTIITPLLKFHEETIVFLKFTSLPIFMPTWRFIQELKHAIPMRNFVKAPLIEVLLQQVKTMLLYADDFPLW